MSTEGSQEPNATTATADQVDTVVVDSEAQESIQAGYDRIANPDKIEAPVEVKKEEPTVATPPEPVLTGEQAKELLAQVARIPDLEKQMRDAGGRYGGLKKSIEDLQQRIASASTASEKTENAADVGELLTDLRDEFPELADKLEGAFSKVMASRGGVNPEEVERVVAERLVAERRAATEDAMNQLTEDHPDWLQVRETPEFQEWKSSLPPRVLARFTRSQDPYYVAEMLDEHKEWLKTRNQQPAPNPPKHETAPATKSRLTNAVLPTNGTRQTPKGEPDPKAVQRAAYERVSGKRL